MASRAILLTPRAARLPVKIEGVFAAEGARTPVTLVNLTTYGFMAETTAEPPVGQQGLLCLPGGEELPAEIRWSQADGFGARFTPALRTYMLACILTHYAENLR